MLHYGTNLVASFNNWWGNNDTSPMIATRTPMVELTTVDGRLVQNLTVNYTHKRRKTIPLTHIFVSPT